MAYLQILKVLRQEIIFLLYNYTTSYEKSNPFVDIRENNCYNSHIKKIYGK